MASALRAALSRNIRVLAGQTVTRHLKVAVGQTPWNLRVPAGQTVAVSGRSWSPLRSMASCSHQNTDSTDELITSIALDVIKSNPNNKSVHNAVDLVIAHPKIVASPKLLRFQVIIKVILKVIEFMENDPEVDCWEVYIGIIGCRCYLTDGTEDLSKDDVISRVLYLVKKHPNVWPSKVTEEAHFSEDLGMDLDDRDILILGLIREFKLWIPGEMYDEIDSVKSAIDYIFDHRDERIHREKLMKKLYPLKDKILSKLDYLINIVCVCTIISRLTNFWE